MLKLDKPRARRTYQSDILRMNIAGYNAACIIAGNERVADVCVTMEQTLSMIKSNPEKVMLVRSSKDVVRAKETGKTGILMGIVGPVKWVMGETDILRMLHRNGVRWVAITHGEGGKVPEEVPKRKRTEVTFPQGSKSPYKLVTTRERAAELKKAIGLTSFDKEFLKVSNEMGIVSDLAHTNDRAFFDVIERTTKPVAVSHTGVFSVCYHTRNLTNDQIKALTGNGGDMSIAFMNLTLVDDPKKATIATF